MSEYNFSSPLQEHIRGPEPRLSKELVQAWIQKRPNEAQATLQNRITERGYM